MIKRFCYFLILFFGSNCLYAQDPLYSQFYAAPLYLNPALAGKETNLIAGINYRSQNNGTQFPNQTGQFSFISPLFNNKAHRKHIGGVGLTVFTDQIGQNYTFKTYGIVGTAAYNLRFDRWRNNFLSFGIQGGFIQKKFDYNSLNWGSQYSTFITGFDNSIQPSLSNINPVSTYPVINAGLNVYINSLKIHRGPSAFFGFAVSNLNRPNESLVRNSVSRVPYLIKVHGGLDFNMNNEISISPQFLLMQQNGINQINIGSYFSYTVDHRADQFIATLGAWYRVNDSFIGLIGFSKSRYTFGFSYDLTSSSLRYYTGKGASEISITYRLPKVKMFRFYSTPLI